MNNIVPTRKFSKLLNKKKNEGSLRNIEKKIEVAMDLFERCKEPESLGEQKKGQLDGLYAYKLNSSSRILYGVERENNEISVTLYRICDHKQVYGKG